MSPSPREAGVEEPKFDADFWPVQATLPMLARFFSDEWRQYLRLQPDGSMSADAFTRSLPESVFWRPGTALRETAGDSAERALDHLDSQHVSRAVINPGVAAAASAVASPYYAAEIARAANDWVIQTWLDRDPRLLGSIVVPIGDPELSAAEIRRIGDHPRMIQVLVAYPHRLLGHRTYAPMFEAALEYDLPITLQSGGAFAASTRGVSAVGEPESHFEYEVSWIAGAQAHLASLLCSGIFDRHPRLRLLLSGFGIAWLPSLIWRIESELRSGRVAKPQGLSRFPGEQIREHVRFTTSSLEVPARPHELVDLLAPIDGCELLLYASGYARGDDQGGQTLAGQLADDQRAAVLRTNAETFFRLSLEQTRDFTAGAHSPARQT
jgi:predicted TIM-barrel fold metal-dependent hydrolase